MFPPGPVLSGSPTLRELLRRQTENPSEPLKVYCRQEGLVLLASHSYTEVNMGSNSTVLRTEIETSTIGKLQTRLIPFILALMIIASSTGSTSGFRL
jgi:hypothetical protein